MIEMMGYMWDASVIEQVYEVYGEGIEEGIYLIGLDERDVGVDIVVYDVYNVKWNNEVQHEFEDLLVIVSENALDIEEFELARFRLMEA